jgi:hypothetical protein
MAVRKTIKTTLNLSGDEVEMVKRLAERRGTTLTNVIRAAIRMENMISEAEATGGKILIESADGTLSRLVFR